MKTTQAMVRPGKHLSSCFFRALTENPSSGNRSRLPDGWSPRAAIYGLLEPTGGRSCMSRPREMISTWFAMHSRKVSQPQRRANIHCRRWKVLRMRTWPWYCFKPELTSPSRKTRVRGFAVTLEKRIGHGLSRGSTRTKLMEPAVQRTHK